MVNLDDIAWAFRWRDKPCSVVDDFRGLPPDEALEKAKKYLADAEKGQENCRSDLAYWAHDKDIALAWALIGYFTCKSKGVDIELPKEHLMLMDMTHSWKEWGKKLGSIQG